MRCAAPPPTRSLILGPAAVDRQQDVIGRRIDEIEHELLDARHGGNGSEGAWARRIIPPKKKRAHAISIS